MAGVIGPFDFTSHFTTNWSGTSMTCDLQVYFDQSTGTTLGMRNVTAVLTITYEYDDTSATQIKTVWIPLESLVGSLTTTANSNIGTNQIPQLTSTGGMLPESGVNIRDYFFVIDGNESTSATTDFTVSVNIDSGTPTAFGVQEAALTSGRYCRWTYSPAVPTTTSTHNFQMWSSLAARLNHVVITLVVTYEFSESSTTSVLNSIISPIEIGSPIGATTSAYASRYTRNFFIDEPGTLSLKQSAFRANFNFNATPTGLNMRAGSQSFRAYTPYGGVVCGMSCLQQRIDSGSAQGVGITLSRGKNTIDIDGYITVTTNQLTNISGYLIINYQSDKSASGIGAHNHTVYKNLYQWNALLQDRIRVDSYSFSIPEASYRLMAVGFSMYHFVTSASEAITMDVQCLSTEGKGAGYYDIYGDAYQSDAEISSSVIHMSGRDVFKRYPNDPGVDRVDIETSRSYRFFSTNNSLNGMLMLVTYHSITYTASGTISGSAGGTVTIKTYRSDNNELVNSTTRLGNGTYSFTWYDDTVELYSEAYEDSTHRGRSINATAGTALDVALSKPVTRAFA
jgi:hypothetical protein